MSAGSLAGGSIRILWDATDSAVVTIDGPGTEAFTVNGGAVTFPYTLSASTTFDTLRSGTYTVSVKHNGYEVAATPDSTRTCELSFGQQVIFAPTTDGSPNSKLLTHLSATYATKPGTRNAFLALSAPNSTSAPSTAFDYAYRTIVRTPFATTRWRIGFANRNLRSGTIPTSPATISGVFLGTPVYATSSASGARWAGAATGAMTNLLSGAITVPTDGTIGWSSWIDAEANQFAQAESKVLGWGMSNPASGTGIAYGDSVQYYRATGNGNAGNATLTSPTLTVQGLLDIVIEYEFNSPGQVGLFVGDSNTIGLAPSPPPLFPSSGLGALPHEGWPAVAGELGGFSSVNIAVGSATPVDFASSLPGLWTRFDLASVDIDFAVVSLGTNGLTSGVANLDNFVSYVLAINTKLRTYGIKRIYWTEVPPRGLTASYSTLAAAASAGATTIQTVAQLTFDDGQSNVLIGSDTACELKTVTSTTPTGSGPYTYTLTSGTANAHALGDTITAGKEAARRWQNAFLRGLPDGIVGLIPFEKAMEKSPESPSADPRYVSSDLLHFTRGAGALRAAEATLAGILPKLT